MPNGYVDMRKLIDNEFPFVFVIGGRGTGKTFNAIDTWIQDKHLCVYMRIKQKEVDMLSLDEDSGFNKYNKTMHANIKIQKGDIPKIMNDDECVGYAVALSTIANIRGVEFFNDADLIIFDEFIQEKHAKAMKYMGTAFLNAYETINRNRELDNMKPCKCICLANANDLGNDIFLELGLVSPVDRNIRKGRNVFVDRERGVMVVLLEDSPISKKKQETALYKLTKKSEYARMSLSNEFAYEEIGTVKRQNVIEYKPLVQIGEITIFKHKRGRKYYIACMQACPNETFGTGEIERERFRKKYGFLWYSYLSDNIIFSEYLSQKLFELYFE